MTEYKELTGEKREKFKKWIKQFQKENDRSPTIEEAYDEATKTIVMEHFEAYGQCRDSRKIADLENKLANVSYQLEGREVELKELQEENKKLTQNLEELELQKTALMDKVNELDVQLHEVSYQMRQYKEQIENMKSNVKAIHFKNDFTKSPYQNMVDEGKAISELIKNWS